MSTPREIIEKIPTSWRENASFADWLVRRVLPIVTVDLGVDLGYSTFTWGLPGLGFVYGIDNFAGAPKAGIANAYEFVFFKRQDLGLDNVLFIPSDFDQAAKGWSTPIDILHIGAFNSSETMGRDYQTWSQFVRPKGVILLSGILVEKSGAQELFKTIERPKITLGGDSGLGVVCDDGALLREITETFRDRVRE